MGNTIQWILIVYLLVMSILDFALFGLDKWKAKHDHWRIRERTLFLFAWLGGGIGGFLGMRLFHHKTKHWYFQVFIPLSIVPWAVLTYWVFFVR